MFKTAETRIGLAIGLPIGLTISYFLFQNLGWYHDYVMWQLKPELLIPAFLVGAYIGWRDNK